MNGESRRTSIIRLHRKWADEYVLVSRVVILLLLGGVCTLFEQLGPGAPERTEAFILLAVIILVTIAWQAAGFGIARVPVIISGIVLESNAAPTNRPSGRS